MANEYTEEQAAAFEKFFEALSRNKFSMAIAIRKMRGDREIAAIMHESPSMATAMELVRSPAYKAWLEDWMELCTLSSIRGAINVLPPQIAAEISGQVRRYFRMEIEALTKKMHADGKLEDFAASIGEEIDQDLLAYRDDVKDEPPENDPVF